MIRGIYAPIPTPFKNDLIDYESLKSNLALWAKTPLTGLVVLGSNGEFAYLSYEEKVELIRFVRNNLPAEKHVIAGTGCESTIETIKLTNKAAELGCLAGLILTPHYYKAAMSNKALYNYYKEVADASNMPIMLYNMPRNAGINMSSDLVLSLANHANIVGIKDSSGNIVQIAEVCAKAPGDFAVFAGSGSFLLPALAVGAVGGTLAVANIMPSECVELLNKLKSGDLKGAKELQYLLLAPNKAVTAKYGIAGLKTALDLIGYKGGEVRKPMLSVSNEVIKDIRNILIEAKAL
ncbi:dihydrodipicolinate synthase family protein [Clostridium sp. 'deep sea']|uniref:dihydrodipicolinate synthase family protein n=1 Tax=Clostridium sp. 'deep sea' TaxID=2779445 RepID=UPI0018965FD2|nr:dihydrodipicolinate synthase family protein [Clostridium sp. 'deep sea']QOR35953.1 dihydrodipicolinate synthase family protein [Clostridium sp. 'deep sea']